MSELEPKYKFTILDKKLHIREAFSSGVPELDNYLKKSANQDANLHLGVVHVMTKEGEDTEIIGYYTLSGYSVNTQELPDSHTKKLPNRRPIATTLLGMMAIDEKYQGQGLGEFLFFDALYRALRISEKEQGSFAVVIDALSDEAKKFYQKYDAVEFVDDPMKLFITMKHIKKVFTDLNMYPLE